MEQVYGDDVIRHPVTAKKLNMVHNLSSIKAEVQMKFKSLAKIKIVSSWWRGFIASWFTKNTSKGKNYLDDMIQLTETILLDGSINTVITGTPLQRTQLLNYLDQLENEHLLSYGYYTSSSSVLSCFVTAIDDYHIHFLDGDNGGYTRASKMLKAKRKA
jgi:hypothetical protein